METEHFAERNDVIRQYGHLWRPFIEKSGVNDEEAVLRLLQLCAACYLDGVDKGSELATVKQLRSGENQTETFVISDDVLIGQSQPESPPGWNPPTISESLKRDLNDDRADFYMV